MPTCTPPTHTLTTIRVCTGGSCVLRWNLGFLILNSRLHLPSDRTTVNTTAGISHRWTRQAVWFSVLGITGSVTRALIVFATGVSGAVHIFSSIHTIVLQQNSKNMASLTPSCYSGLKALASNRKQAKFCFCFVFVFVGPH